MRKVTIGLFLVLMLFTVNSVSALELSYSNPYGVCAWTAPKGFSSSDPNDYVSVVAFSNASQIYKIYPPNYAEPSLIFVGASGVSIHDMVYTQDHLWLVYSNGQVYRCPNKVGVTYWNNLALDEKILITTVSGVAHYKMGIDNNGYIYVTNSKYLYQINPSTLAVTSSTEQTYALTSISATNTKMITGCNDAGDGDRVDVVSWNSMTSTTTTNIDIDQQFATSGYTGCLGLGVIPLMNDKYVILRMVDGSDTSHLDKYALCLTNSSYIITTLLYINTGSYTAGSRYGDVYVTETGIVICSILSQGKIYTYSVDAAGFNFASSNYVPAKLIYDTTDVYTDYQNYYNGSSVDTHYSIALDMDDQDIKFYSKDIISNRFNWKIELIDPAGVLIQSYNIPENFDRESILSNTWFITSSIRFNSITGNGTYILNLFEVDSNTNEKSLLDSTTFDILYNTNPGTTGGTTETEPGNVATNILSSVYFQAFLLIMVCALSGGSVAQGAGLGGGGLIGTVGCVMFGLLPYGFAFIIAIICCAVVALAIAEKISGG